MMGFPIPDNMVKVIDWQIAPLVLAGIFILSSVARGILTYSIVDFATSMDLDGHSTVKRGSFIRLYLKDII